MLFIDMQASIYCPAISEKAIVQDAGWRTELESLRKMRGRSPSGRTSRLSFVTWGLRGGGSPG